MAPFGPSWFGILEEPGHPLADLRYEWLVWNQHLDRVESRETREADLDFVVSFVNPRRWAEYRLLREAPQGQPEAAPVISEGETVLAQMPGMTIVQDDSEYRRLRAMILQGEASGDDSWKQHVQGLVSEEDIRYANEQKEQRAAQRAALIAEQIAAYGRPRDMLEADDGVPYPIDPQTLR